MNTHVGGWLTPAEASRLIEVSEETLRRWRSAGIGPVWHRHGPRLIRYERTSVQEWLHRPGAA
jgi:excisionase family DNA binding protein